VTNAEALREMLADGVIFGRGENDDEPPFVVNLSDTFTYACADGERIPPELLDEVVRIYREFGPVGCVCWAAARRNHEPVVEYTEDPVYQATWRALYGARVVGYNLCNQIPGEERWSQDRLHLKPWAPR
jgi:hypothetical protein